MGTSTRSKVCKWNRWCQWWWWAVVKKSPSRPSTGAAANKTLPLPCRLACAADSCSPAAAQVQLWSVADVVNFVKAIDLCHEYAEVFREHSIDGCTLPLLTEEH